MDCCGDGSEKYWDNCAKFYQLYPSSRVDNSKKTLSFSRYFILLNFLTDIKQILNYLGWGGGDPQLTTYDNRTFTFNGLGKYILSKANDSSFEIQASTFQLPSNSSNVGTLYENFAIKTAQTPIIQIELVDSSLPNPYFGKNYKKSFFHFILKFHLG